MTLYLNNSGSRWIEPDMRFVLVLPDGSRKVRKGIAWEAFGNFAVLIYRVSGKTFRGMPKANDGTETRLGTETGNDALVHIFHANSGIQTKDGNEG